MAAAPAEAANSAWLVAGTARSYACRNDINYEDTNMDISNAIRNHSNYDTDDYNYLRAKGWTDAEILERWNAEALNGRGPCRWQAEPARSKLAAVLGN